MSKYRNENNNENEKQCPKCGEIKPRTYEFWNKHSSKPDGLNAWCKVCVREKSRSKQRKEYLKEWRKNNPDKVKAHNERQKECIQKWRRDNPDKIKEYKEAHREEENRKRRERRATDPNYKIRCNVSCGIYHAIRRYGNSKKDGSCFEHLPYTVKQLREHLEAQFDENMTWENYGSYWHIDHIHPQSLLPYQSMEEENFLKCWSLDNLQPLEAGENIRKSNKIVE